MTKVATSRERVKVSQYLEYICYAKTNREYPDHVSQNAVPELGLQCLPLIQQFTDIHVQTGSKMDLFKIKEKYGKEL